MSEYFKDELIDSLVKDADNLWPENFKEIEEMFNACSFAICVDTVKQLGLFQKKEDFETMESIKDKISLFEDAEYVMAKVCNILCEENVLQEKDNGYICIDDNPDIASPAELLVEAVRKFPEEGAAFQWLARGGGGLAGFITGKLYGEEVMFPWNDFKLTGEVYDTSNVYGFYSKLAAKVVKRIIDNIYSEPVSLLEVGAGTGNGTRCVFKETKDKFKKYLFTDISKSLVKRSKKQMAKAGYDFDYLEYQELDISKDPVEQGIEKESADILLAVNVIHATDDVVESLKATRDLLKKSGACILAELSPPSDGLYRYMELTFGLIASFYKYEDKSRRPISPIIRPVDWEKAYKEAGFSEVVSIPGDKLPHSDRGGVVIGIK